MSKKKKPSPQRGQQNNKQYNQQQQSRQGAMPSVRLSQCMIVKNEEKNIERALEWAKDIAYEQIVVDTGSTDKTVELAKKMGATVYHFDWINDFAAAKNFAMDKAKGEWIAILDADEYMSKEDANELISLLGKIKSDPIMSKKCEAIVTTFVNVDDKDNILSVIKHIRVFKNRHDIRFVGKIHEVVNLKNSHFEAPQIRIIHTGYTQASYVDADKANRNIEMLRNELKGDPDNPDIMLYLADSIKTADTAEAREEAESLFYKALQSTKKSNVLVKQLAYNYLIPRYITDENKHDEAMRLCDEAIKNLPEFIDYSYYRGVLNNKIGSFDEAMKDFTVCENAFLNSPSIPTTNILMPSPLLLFYQMQISAKGLDDDEGIMKTGAVIQAMLLDNKEHTHLVGPYIRVMLKDGVTADDVLNELSSVYNIKNPKDLLLIARAAKDSGAVEFTRNVMKLAEKMLENSSQVRLSQCMIVKNEEKNIEKALTWAKDIAFEQIVVDTGSTDRTVEIAEEMGAKVYHFEWINDFAAAKNFAMDKASGNWIAILDADEYMEKEDTDKLISLLNEIQSDPKKLSQYDALNTSWVQLDDNGKAYTVLTQMRIFQNRPDLRYAGKIHEAVGIRKHYSAEDVRIMHTGYSQSSFNEAGKRERNIKLLKEEHKRDPKNAHTTLYLADSIKSDGTEESYAEAEKLYLKGLYTKPSASPEIRRIAYDFLIPRFSNVKEKEEQAMKLCNEAISVLPDHVDYYYYRAILYKKNGDYKTAMNDLQKCEEMFMTSLSIPETRVLMPSPIVLFYQLLCTAEGLGDELGINKYKAVINAMLTEGKDQPGVLGAYLAALFSEGKTGIEVFEKLSPIYDTNNKQDMLSIARAAKTAGIAGFGEKIEEIIGENA